MNQIELHEKYKPLWNSKCYIYLVTGGRGSGKSFAVGDFIENLSFEQGHKILFTRYTLDSAGDSIIPEFEEKIEREGHTNHFYVTKKDVINVRSGSEILFRGIKTSSGIQTAKLKSIEGLTTWVLDEAEELPDEKTFNVIMQSIRKKDKVNRIILVLNPKSQQHWIYKKFFEGPGIAEDFNGEHENICYIHTTYLENLKNLSQEFIDEADKCKRVTPEIYDYDYLGKWVLSIEGAVFKWDSLQRYAEMNEEGANICFIDTADEGADHFAGLFGKLLNKQVYIFDAIFNLANLNINEEVCKERFERHKIDRVYVETNSAGAYFKRNLVQQNSGIYIYGQFSKANKMGRILSQSGWILQFFHFPEAPNPELLQFMKQMCSVTIDSKDQDDASDAAAGLAASIRRDFHIA